MYCSRLLLSVSLSLILLFLRPSHFVFVSASLGGDDASSFTTSLTSLTSSEPGSSSCYSKIVGAYMSAKPSALNSPSTSVCLGMSEATSSSLAYMLASCHYRESGRRMRGVDGALEGGRCDFLGEPDAEDREEEATQTKAAVVVREDAVRDHFAGSEGESCTQLLTEPEFAIYTQFKVHVFAVCDKLTAEHWREQNGRQIRALGTAAAEVAESLGRQKADLEASLIKTDAALTMQSELLEKTDEHLRLTDQHLALTDGLFATVEERHMETMKRMQDSHESAVDKATEIRKGQEAISTTISETTANLQNLKVSISAIEDFATNAWTYAKRMATVSHFLALINAAYVLTSTEVTRKARTSLFTLGAANAGLEYLAGWAVESGKIPEDQKEHLVLNLRTWCLFICIVIFLDCIRSWLVRSLRSWWRGGGYEDGTVAQPWETRARALTREDVEAINKSISDTMTRQLSRGGQETSSLSPELGRQAHARSLEPVTAVHGGLGGERDETSVAKRAERRAGSSKNRGKKRLCRAVET
eukprot:CAMPEP_0182480746 /NCGR_PEP_ID=MMETSP1319-20130603/36289_1 /TAXON_ID=172717 /ORGANISM="Bolidomonas pacifica, Strain RCC208" /LENGTH=529 /DNA_ID=CAMNT_0024682291 /DNA_START=136 /DNA_END=1721 /DNA_ORIENTATION=-